MRFGNNGRQERHVNETIAEQIAPLATRVAERRGCELVDVVYSPGRLRIVIDRPENEGVARDADGVDVEDCAVVSRQLSTLLDVEDVIAARYTLEVSSPGVERTLLLAADYRRYAGATVSIDTDGPVSGRERFRGVLRGLRRDQVVVEEPSGERVLIPLRRVALARLDAASASGSA